jgi:hypothetical protein
MFDEIVKQGVPERFARLVEQIDERGDAMPTADAGSEASATTGTSEQPRSPAVHKRPS